MSTAQQTPAASEAGISFRELLAYTDYLMQRWMKYFDENPSALEVEIGGRTPHVRDLVFHIVLVEQTFANLLHDNKPADPPTIAAQKAEQEPRTADNLARLHREAHDKLIRYAASAKPDDVTKVEHLGPANVTRRKILSQVTLHSTHHWAQIAMAVRQAGFPTRTPQDIIVSDVMK